MRNEIDGILQDCLDRIENEGATIEDCLALYPQHKEELRELLVLSISLGDLILVSPSKEFSTNASNRLIAKLPDQPSTIGNKIRQILQSNYQLPQRQMALARILITLAIVIILGTTVVYAADAAGPGDFLYPLDRSIERIRLQVTSDPQEIVKLRLAHAAERLEEAAENIEFGYFENSKLALEAYQLEIDQFSSLMIQTNTQNRLAIETMINEGLAIHEETLRRLMTNAPEDAQEPIKNAIEASRKGLIDRESPTQTPAHNQDKNTPQRPMLETPQSPNQGEPNKPSNDPQQGPKEQITPIPTGKSPEQPIDNKPQGTSANTPQSTNADTPPGNSDDPPQGPAENTPQGPEDDAPQGTHETTPQGSTNENHAKP